ncbi:MAG: type I-C CRISPR-associated protein Cas8c/Csd1 [Rhodocyclaceae bacterium]|nr:type I-C CRISPR-associated protein Cas8c/Csd1 [Rhodocyclaceae bacterium]
MILQALAEYYARKPKADEALDGLSPIGMEENGIGFAIVLDDEGRVVNIADLRTTDGKKMRARPLIVPMSCDRTGKHAWETSFLLWDYPRYVLGVLGEKDEPEMAEKRISTFRKTLSDAFPDPSVDTGVLAVHRFYENFAANIATLKADPLWSELAASTFGVSFRLRDATDLVCQSAAVRHRARELFEQDELAPRGQCLISGEEGRLQVLHPATPVPGAKATAKILSFNEPAYESYGKRGRQGENAPVGKTAAFAYTTALNHLLRAGSKQKLRVGEDTVVFWASRDTPLEADFSAYFDFDERASDDPDAGVKAIRALYASVKEGVRPVLDDETCFFVLRLAPNSARIAVRFWLTGTVPQMAQRIVRHFDDLAIVHGDKDPPFLSLRTLLRAVATQSKDENIPPNLGGELMRAILLGLPYPETLFQNALRRIRQERDVGYARAALLKACLNRKPDPNEKEMTVSLDKENTNPGYRLGRLFAVLERVQEEANPGLNATIRDRYYGAFSATPAAVFATLMRLKNHHLAKLENAGRRANLEKLIGEIVAGLPPTLPTHLSLADQGRFAIGYYHQRMDSGTYKSTVKENDNG